MSEVKFSNGPWTIEKLEFGDGFKKLADSDGKTLMSNETYYPYVPESNHDWSLIAAAPEMYEMLYKLANSITIEYSYESAKPIFNLLAKARGEHYE